METYERIIGFDAQLLFDAAIVGIAVLLLFVLLSYLLFNPIQKVLAERKTRIATEVETAKTNQAEAMALKEKYENRLAEVEKEANQILEEARKKAKLNESEILKEAMAEAVRVKERASREIELEKKKAMEEVKQEFVNIATLIATKAVEASMDVQISTKLIDDTLGQIGESTWQS